MPVRKISCAVLFFFISIHAYADVVIKVRAINPLDTETTAPIKYPLPKAVKPEDIISKSHDFKIRYDKKNGCYYIDHEIVLAPKEIVTLSVNVKDVWFIPEERIEALRGKVEEIVRPHTATAGMDDTDTRLPAGRQASVWWQLKEEILKQLDQVAASQKNNTVTKIGVEKHIKAYEENMKILSQVEQDIAMLKGLLKQNKKRKK